MAVQKVETVNERTARGSVAASIAPEALRGLLARGEAATLIDVRSPAEHRVRHVAGARLIPLEQVTPDVVRAAAGDGGPIYLLCERGSRARKAQTRLAEAGVTNTVVVEGGTDACDAAGVPMVRGRGLPLHRQALLGAGVVVWTGLILGWFVSPWFLLIVAFAGCGLIAAGALDFCLMAIVLARMPWNRGGASVTCPSQGTP